MLSSPTGSGKTLMATAFMEGAVAGDAYGVADPEATFLWLSDQPDLNEQTRRKIIAASNVFGASDLVTIDQSFDQEVLDPGRVYFLNTQKLGKDKQLIGSGDKRTHTIWETINNTGRLRPSSFVLILDEAHKGMKQRNGEAKVAQSIVQKFIKGAASELDPVPIILGISATPTRFTTLLQGVSGVITRSVTVDVGAVRESGLIKDKVLVRHPVRTGGVDWSLLQESAKTWADICNRWASYSAAEHITVIRPIFVVQVEDGSARRASATDLARVLQVIESQVGTLRDEEIAHSFQEGSALDIGGRVIRRVAPPDIQDDSRLRVVLFKLSLNTGWDCPRAEVMMSFRRAVDHTAIAQLVGRMVRTPLARRVEREEILNTVTLYLPSYDRAAVKSVIEALTKQGDEVISSDVEDAESVVPELVRTKGSKQAFALLEALPSYRVTKTPKQPNIRRLVALGRYLEQCQLEDGSADATRNFVVGQLLSARKALAQQTAFRAQVDGLTEVAIEGLAVELGGGVSEESPNMVRLHEANLEDMFSLCERRLGEGLHLEYVRQRLDKRARPDLAKRELLVLLTDQNLWETMDEKAGEKLGRYLRDHQPGINKLSDESRQLFDKVRRTAKDPEPTLMHLPETILATKSDRLWGKHLFVEESGQFPFAATGWERPLLEKELAAKDVVAWLRNPPRKDWSFSVVYRDEHGELANMYPDFLLIRRQKNGLVVDILEPHRENEGDAPRKVMGLADYAAKHGGLFHRIAMISKGGDGVFRELDLNHEPTRDAARMVTTTSAVVNLFEAHGKPVAGLTE